jgi:hypothetical protein
MSVEATARKGYKAMESYVASCYFMPEGPANYEKVGLKPLAAYLCGRVAAMGAVPGEVVVATFYNFNPALVVPQVNKGWKITTPQAISEARNLTVTQGLTRMLTDENGNLPDVSRAIELVKKAVVGLKSEGRALFAGHQAQPWVEDNALLSLWWGCNLLREYRGDGHVAALLVHQVSGLESFLLHAAWENRPLHPGLVRARAWTAEEMEAAYNGLIERGLLNGDKTITEEGKALRESIEAATDRLAVAPWQKLGDEADEFLGIMFGLSKTIRSTGIFG